MNNTQLRGTQFSATATGTTSAQAVTTQTGVLYYVTDIAASSSGTTVGLWQILGGTTGTTVYWQGLGTVNESFTTPIRIATTGTIGFLANGVTATSANISGYYI